MDQKRLLLIDGNSIMNRAFYGIMSSKMLTAPDGTYTNALYGFLSILFKELEDLNPTHIAVAFDLKAPTHRHKMYQEYKAGRHAMPEELKQQMPLIKDILRDMNITILEKEGYEADDILGTMAKRAEKENIAVTILSGDRDTFQLATDQITIRIPRTKAGKTEEDDYDQKKIKETYGITPRQLIEVKGLMGDPSDHIPGVPGVGEKTALKLIQEYQTLDQVYQRLENNTSTLKGALKDKLIQNRELAYLSKTLGEILLDVPIDISLENLERKEWNHEKVAERFKSYGFHRFIERFHLNEEIPLKTQETQKDLFEILEIDFKNVQEVNEQLKFIKEQCELIYCFDFDEEKNQNIIHKKIKSMAVLNKNKNVIIYIYNITNQEKLAVILQSIFESSMIKKIGYDLKIDYVLMHQLGIQYQNIDFDVKIAGYDLDPTRKNTLDEMVNCYLEQDIEQYVNASCGSIKNDEQMQMTLFDNQNTDNSLHNEREKYTLCTKVFFIGKLREILKEKLKEINALDLFCDIEMPLVEVLANMQCEGMYVDKNALKEFGEELKKQIDDLTKEIYELAEEEFNINSHQQLGNILFEKLKLPSQKKTKTGYSTDVDVLEKIKFTHPIVNKVLEYRSLTKLNSTYVEGLIPYINTKTNRIHSYFHQTITATGRISSTEPNLQNIPTRAELGKNIRKAFQPREGYVYIDADYSQIELRILAHISQDETMLDAFRNGEDIHKQAASKVLGIPIEEVTKEQRSSAKAVNFGIVYGISDFGLANQLGISNKQAKEYITQYLDKYQGIKQFMDEIVENAKAKGYVETLFHRRRYIPELQSSNYMVRQFGARIAMNTPIQGTAADIMKIAMIRVFQKLKEQKIDAKIILQIHDELLLEAKEEEKEKAKQILQSEMMKATTLSIPLEVEVSEGKNWYETK